MERAHSLFDSYRELSLTKHLTLSHTRAWRLTL